MAFPLFFILFIILIVLFQHHLRKNMRIEEKSKEEFWRKEQSSLVVRKKEISKDDYIIASIESLTFPIPDNITEADQLHLSQVVKRLKNLSKLDMMNFSNLTNTELRLKFGTANQSIITTNEYNYNNFLKSLSEYAKIMANYNNECEAISALEQCIELKSDYSTHFIELGKLYKSQNMSVQFKELLEKANLLDSINKKGILDKLESL